MTGLLLILLIALETAFIIFEALKKSSDKRTWTLRRLIVNTAQLVLFGIMLASPGIDTSFRFTGLMILLAVRIVFAAVFAFAYRRNTDAKKTGRKVGFKAAGGISNAQDALCYYSIVSGILGLDWLDKSLFRFGVSRLGNSLMSAVEQSTVTFF